MQPFEGVLKRITFLKKFSKCLKKIGKIFFLMSMQKNLFMLQNTFKIRENKSRARCEIYSKLTIKTAE